MKEVEANRRAWARLARDHYECFTDALGRHHSLLSETITRELGDVTGKSIIHLQCNTGADTISLARLGARVTGVDLVPENIHYAEKMASEHGVHDAVFIESDIMTLMDSHHDRYDIVFTSDGAIGWLPDLGRWGMTIRHLLRDDGFFYICDGHPFGMVFDEEKMTAGVLEIAYPYFERKPDREDTIGGYAGPAREAENYFWMYTVGDVINALARAGLCIEFFNEFDTLCYDMGGMERVGHNAYRSVHFRARLPLSFSLKATVRR